MEDYSAPKSCPEISFKMGYSSFFCTLCFYGLFIGQFGGSFLIFAQNVSSNIWERTKIRFYLEISRCYCPLKSM